MSFIIAVFALYAVVSIGSCKSSGPEVQQCGYSHYYCKTTQQCLPREDRCVGRDSCLNVNEIEDGCDCDSSYQYCTVYFGRTHFSSSGSSSKKRGLLGCLKFIHSDNREHHFIRYRGFTWEFGKSYLTQILDINDPNYKYDRPEESSLIKSVTSVGNSSCTYDQVLIFINDFDKRYRLCSNNCQHFAKGLQQWLLNDCTYPTKTYCTYPTNCRVKRETNDTVSEYFAMISQEECSEGKCAQLYSTALM